MFQDASYPSAAFALLYCIQDIPLFIDSLQVQNFIICYPVSPTNLLHSSSDPQFESW